MPGLVIGVLCGVVLLGAGCGVARQEGAVSGRNEPLPADATAGPAERILTAEVVEKNLRLAGEEAARDYLRQKLVGLLARQLADLGFDPVRAGAIALAGKLLAFSVRDHRERVLGKGPEEGTVQDLVLWDVQGRLQVLLTDADLEALGERLAVLSGGALDEVETVVAYLDRVQALGPERRKFSALRQQVADAWAEALRPVLETQGQFPVAPAEPFWESFQAAAGQLAKFCRANPEHRERENLEKTLTRAALGLLHTVEVKASCQPALQALLDRMRKIVGIDLPDVMRYLEQDLELSWRNRLEKLSASAEPFPQVYADFYLFLQEFPESDFYPRLELLFLSKWARYLAGRQAKDLPDLVAYLQEVKLLRQRFPSAASLEDVGEALGRQCLQVLSGLQAADLTALETALSALKSCDAFLPAGKQTAPVRAGLVRLMERLTHERDDRREQEMLGPLFFFREWDPALKKLPWGKPRETFPGRGPFLSWWEKGKDAGSDCRCTLDPQEPCRLVEAQDLPGGFEVVARFYDGKLEGVDLCRVFVGDRIDPLYRFFQRRYQKAHSEEQATGFLSGRDLDPSTGQIVFRDPSGLQVTLQRFAESVNAQYRYGPLSDRRVLDEERAREEDGENRRQSRKKRIEQGWSEGACVRFGCADMRSDCTYVGRVRSRKDDRYEVLVTGSEQDPIKKGRYLWINAGDLFDCQ